MLPKPAASLQDGTDGDYSMPKWEKEVRSVARVRSRVGIDDDDAVYDHHAGTADFVEHFAAIHIPERRDAECPGQRAFGADAGH